MAIAHAAPLPNVIFERQVDAEDVLGFTMDYIEAVVVAVGGAVNSALAAVGPVLPAFAGCMFPS
jgi:hypothetical protein